ncbi:uncharacterized protein LOC136089885 [Hydra vulgaris]|uniref:Uncharacterized protein LOC136089885 n=1 Tax=Hydra vulgaris TaxID=6087 RepID=A0ABM4DCC5_HYDVU
MLLSHSEDKFMNLECGIGECKYLYNTANTFKWHINKCHKIAVDESLLKNTDSKILDSQKTEEYDARECEENLFLNIDESLMRDFMDFSECFSRQLCHTKLYCREKFMLPKSVIKQIFEQVQTLFDLYQSSISSIIRAKLKHCGIDWKLDYVYRQILEEDSFYEPISKSTSTDHLMESYMKLNLDYVPPIEYNISPIDNRFIVTDELEICNPLGSRKGTHKISVFYFIVGNIESKYWSSLNHIHLALISKYSIIKEHGYALILQPLLNDLMILQNEGININVEGITHNLKGSIVTLSGDNLSAHTIGGFSACFSSGRICRNCMVPHINIRNIKTESQCILRTKTSHNYHVNSVLIDPTLMPVYGVKKECPFSILNYFHPIDSMPQDILHDILEGLMSVNFSVVIKGLVKNKFLTVCELRNILKNFKYGITERCNKPLPSNVPLNLVSSNKHISGKAVERWSLFYHLPLYIGKVVPYENEYWLLHLLCRKLCQIILSPVIDIEWIPVLTHLISRHHELLARLNPKSFTPKIHFLVHYP